MLHLNKLPVLLLTGILSQSAPVAASGDFHYEAPLSDGKSSLRSTVLPWTVLSHLLQENQADLQVYNADNQAVPFNVRPLATPLMWQTVNLQAGETPQQFRYDIPPSLPISQWRMAMPQPGSLYEGTLYARAPTRPRYGSQPAPWIERSSFRHYHLQTAAGVVRSEPDTVSDYLDKQWQLDFQQPLPTTTPLALEIGWTPLELRFIAQGKAPFRLVYGSRQTQSVFPMRFDETLANTHAENVTVGQEVVLSPVEAEILPTRPWLTWLLWGVLGSAVVVLLWMAKRLLGEMKQEQG